MSKSKPRCIQILGLTNDKSKCGICVGIWKEGHPDAPEDVVSLCTGELDENGSPKEQTLMTLEEADKLGMALIRVRAVYESIEGVKHVEAQT